MNPAIKSKEYLIYLTFVFSIGSSILLLYFNPELFQILGREDHIAEYGTAVLLGCVSVILFLVFLRIRGEYKFLSVLFLITSILFFLGMGEEVSWGQRIVGFGTPEDLAAINDQDEVNFHNINKYFFDSLLLHGILFLCLIIIVLRLLKFRTFINIPLPSAFVTLSALVVTMYAGHYFYWSYWALVIGMGTIGLHILYGILNKDYILTVMAAISLFIYYYLPKLLIKLSELLVQRNSINEYRELFIALIFVWIASGLYKNYKNVASAVK
ncbi:MAG: hypothetical protein WBA16_11085 [Nonlabens sp.]